MTSGPLIPLAKAVAALRPRRPGKCAAILERGVREGLIAGENLLGETFIEEHEMPRLQRAAWDRTQDDQLRRM